MLKTFTKARWKLVLDAYGIAGQVLDNSVARKAITDGTISQPAGLSGNGDPRDVLRDIFTRGKTTHAKFGYDIVLPPSVSSPALIQLYTDNRGVEYDFNMKGSAAAAGTTEHSRGYIRIGDDFFVKNIINKMGWGQNGPPKLNAEQTGALILLHEIKHIITGDYSNAHDVPFNTRIYNDGFKNLKVKR
jgi:hypothetical protein